MLAYLLAEVACLCSEWRARAAVAHLLGHSCMDAEGVLEVILPEQLQHQVHILLALGITQAALRTVQRPHQLLQLWGERNRGAVRKEGREGNIG